MGVQISLHAAEYGSLLKKLKQDRAILISEADIGFRILNYLKLSGKERRPLTDEELKTLINHYKYFNHSFTRKQLLPIKEKRPILHIRDVGVWDSNQILL